VEKFPDVIGEQIEGTQLYKPGPGDPGVVLGSVLICPGLEYPRFVKERSPGGEVWRRLDAPEIPGETQ